MKEDKARWRPPVWFLLITAAAGIALGEFVYRSWTGPVLVEPFLQDQLTASRTDVRNHELPDLP